jgi:hypothetical protein
VITTNAFQIFTALAVSVGILGDAIGQTPSRTSNGLIIKTTSKISPPASVLAKAGAQKMDTRAVRLKQAREASLGVSRARAEQARQAALPAPVLQRGSDGKK